MSREAPPPLGGVTALNVNLPDAELLLATVNFLASVSANFDSDDRRRDNIEPWAGFYKWGKVWGSGVGLGKGAEKSRVSHIREVTGEVSECHMMCQSGR